MLDMSPPPYKPNVAWLVDAINIAIHHTHDPRKLPEIYWAVIDLDHQMSLSIVSIEKRLTNGGYEYSALLAMPDRSKPMEAKVLHTLSQRDLERLAEYFGYELEQFTGDLPPIIE